VVDAGSPTLVDDIKAATYGGIHVAIDSVGGEQFDAALRASLRDARILVVGFAGGTIPQIPANRILLKELDVLGVYWGDWAARNPQRDRANFNAMFDLIAEGKLQPIVDATYTLADAPQAVADLHERRLIGKGVVRVR
jgi:NADPH2:quinone reductase